MCFHTFQCQAEDKTNTLKCNGALKGISKALCVLIPFTRVRLCDPMDCSPPGSSVRGILQERILEWVAMPSSRGSSQPSDQTQVSYVSCIGRRIL